MRQYLSDRTNQMLDIIKDRFSKTALTKKDFQKSAIHLTTRLIPLDKALQAIEFLPILIGYLIAKRKLNDFLVFGLEREYFTYIMRVARTGIYESSISIGNLTKKNAWINMVFDSSHTVKVESNAATKLVPLDDLVSSLEIKKIASLSCLDLSGYNTFWDHNNDGDYYPLLSKMDTPLNLAHEKTLTPAEVIGDYIEIDLLAHSLTSANSNRVHQVNDNKYYRVDKRNIKNDRVLLEERLHSFTQKYPVLKGCEVVDFDRYLLNHYSMAPNEIIKRFGYQVLCVPFDLDDNADWLSGKTVSKDWTISSDLVIASSPAF